MRSALAAIHRGVRNYLWYWVIMLVVALAVAFVFGAHFGVTLLGVVFFTFLLVVAVLFLSLWRDLKRRSDIDRFLLRATEIRHGDLSEETDAELEHLLPPLVAAGFVVIDGESSSGYLWRFTSAGVRRQEVLGVR